MTFRAGIAPDADITIFFRSADIAVNLPTPPRRPLDMINAMKNFQLGMSGPEDLSVRFMESLHIIMTAGDGEPAVGAPAQIDRAVG